MASNLSAESSPLVNARVAGALWLAVIAVSIFAVVSGPSLNPHSDPATLVAAVFASEPQIRLAFVATFAGSLFYLGVTVLLYELLKPVNRSVALFGAFCGLAGIVVGAAASVNDLATLALVDDARRTAAPVSSLVQNAVQMFVSAAEPEFKVGMVFFGFQIASVGYLIFRSTFLPRVIGVILMLGGSSYVISSFASFVSATMGATLAPFVIPIAILGEGSLTLWLLVKGVDVEKWQRSAQP